LKSTHKVGIVAIICLTALEVTALLTHTDGAFFMPVVSAISGIAGAIIGYKYKEVYNNKKEG